LKSANTKRLNKFIKDNGYLACGEAAEISLPYVLVGIDDETLRYAGRTAVETIILEKYRAAGIPAPFKKVITVAVYPVCRCFLTAVKVKCDDAKIIMVVCVVDLLKSGELPDAVASGRCPEIQQDYFARAVIGKAETAGSDNSRHSKIGGNRYDSVLGNAERRALPLDRTALPVSNFTGKVIFTYDTRWFPLDSL
jgi:hypothetical protein